MTIRRIVTIAHIALVAAILLLAAHPSPAQQPGRHDIDLTSVKPESVGFSSARLEWLHALMQKEVDQKHFSGIVTLLARHGKVVDYRAYGMRNLETGAPMTKDTIFRDFSMTKPVTGVALMILYEQGKWLPSDPISKFIPEFANLKVFKGVDTNGNMILVDPEHAPTMSELMTHTAGFSYGEGNTVVDAMYNDQHVLESQNLQEMIDKLAKIPLLYQPGKSWIYSMSMDIEGYIVEKLSGQPLPDFMRDQIFSPLGMQMQASMCLKISAAASPRSTRRMTTASWLSTWPAAAAHASTKRSPPCHRAAAAWSPPQKITTALPRCSSTMAN